MNRRLKYVFAIYFTSCFFMLQSQTWNWGKSQKGFSHQVSNDVTIDSSNQVFICGNFQDSINLLGSYLTSLSESDGFIAKYSEDGNILWQKSIHGNGNLNLGFINYWNDELYISGSFRDSLFYNSDTLFSSGSKDLFFGKLDILGNVLWMKQIKGLADEDPKEMIISDGRWFISGLSTSSSILYNDTLIDLGNGSADAINFELDLNGNIIWKKTIGGLYEDETGGIALDGNNHLILQVSYSNEVIFGDNTLVSLAEHDIALCKINLNNDSIVWSKSMGSYADDHGGGICLGNNGDIYSTGDFNNDLISGNNDIQSNGSYDVFISKHSNDGILLWMKNAGWTGSDYGFDIAFKNDLIFTTGKFAVQAEFGTISVQSSALSDAFVSISNQEGEFLHVLSTSGNSSTLCESYSITIGNNYQAYICGVYRGYPNFSNNLTPKDLNEGFVAQLIYDQTVNRRQAFSDLFTKLYPNPCQDNFSIYPNNEIDFINLFNSSGQLIFQTKKLINIDVSKLSSGLYFVQTMGGENSLNTLIISE